MEDVGDNIQHPRKDTAEQVYSQYGLTAKRGGTSITTKRRLVAEARDDSNSEVPCKRFKTSLKVRLRQRALYARKLAKKERGKGGDASSDKIEKLEEEEAASRIVVKMLNKEMLYDGCGMQEGSKEHSKYLRSIEELRTVLVKVNKLSRAEVPIVSDDEMMQDLDRE